jgi:hypothetical protein
MVATERRMRAETEEELKELKQEKEALRSALRLIDGENTTLRGPKEKQISEIIAGFSPPPSRSSSRMAVKSRPASLDLVSTFPPLPPSPSVSPRSSFDEDNHPTPIDTAPVLSPEEETQPTPRYRRAMLRISEAQDGVFMGSSPWADDVTSTPVSQPKYSTVAHITPC